WHSPGRHWRCAPRYLNVCTPSSVRPIAYESCLWGEKAWPTKRASTRSRPCALRPRRMYSRVPPPAASRRTPSEDRLDGGRGSPVFRISEAYQDHDSNCTPPPITTVQDPRRRSAYSEDVMPARAIRRQRGLSTCSLPAI